MPKYCPECGKKVAPTDKFCKGCGTSLAKPVEVQKKELKPERPLTSVQTPTTFKPLPESKKSALSSTTTSMIILLVVGMIFFFVYLSTSSGGPCPEEEGMVLCGYCSEDRLATGNPHGGQCRYCPTGYSCVGDVCGEITCSPGDGGGGGSTIAQQYCSSGYCLSNGHCCPSYARYYCEGDCYSSSTEAQSASQGRCSSFKIYC